MTSQKQPAKLIVTVTSVRGQPTLEFDRELSNEQIADIVLKRFGVQESEVWALPHNFCGVLVPTPPELDRTSEHFTPPPSNPFFMQPGHLRAI